MRLLTFVFFFSIFSIPSLGQTQSSSASDDCPSGSVTGTGNGLFCTLDDPHCVGSGDSPCDSKGKETEQKAAATNWEAKCDEHCKHATVTAGYKCVRKNDGGGGSGSCDGAGQYTGTVTKNCQCTRKRIIKVNPGSLVNDILDSVESR
jgi:hypothetical protein